MARVRTRLGGGLRHTSHTALLGGAPTWHTTPNWLRIPKVKPGPVWATFQGPVTGMVWRTGVASGWSSLPYVRNRGGIELGWALAD